MPGLNNEEYQVVIGNDTTHYIIDDLEPASNYTFYIVAYMPLGASQMSDHVTQHTLEDGKTNTTDLGENFYLHWVEMCDPVLTVLEDPKFPLTISGTSGYAQCKTEPANERNENKITF